MSIFLKNSYGLFQLQNFFIGHEPILLKNIHEIVPIQVQLWINLMIFQNPFSYSPWPFY